MSLVKNDYEIELMRKAGKIGISILREIINNVKSGITTREINKQTMSLCLKHGVRPAFLQYNGFPFAICTSIDEEIVHCFPSDRVLEPADMLSLDFGVVYEGYCSDLARTLIVDDVDMTRKIDIIGAAKLCYNKAVEIIKPGIRVSDISYEIQKTASSRGFFIVKDFCSHSIGKNIHEPPQILNYGMPGKGAFVEEGMTLAIEPIIREDKGSVVFGDNKWNTRTDSGSLSAHYENTVLVTNNGVEELTTI